MKQTGQVRIRPVLMTTLTTVLGLLSIALGFGESTELRSPMVVTVIGGLLVGILLTLVVIQISAVLGKNNRPIFDTIE